MQLKRILSQRNWRTNNTINECVIFLLFYRWNIFGLLAASATSKVATGLISSRSPLTVGSGRPSSRSWHRRRRETRTTGLRVAVSANPSLTTGRPNKEVHRRTASPFLTSSITMVFTGTMLPVIMSSPGCAKRTRICWNTFDLLIPI